MSKVVVLALKDLLLIWRDKMGLFWIVVFPLIMATFTAVIFSGSGGKGGPSGSMRIAMVDSDRSTSSTDFIEELRKSESLEVVHLGLKESKDQVRRGKLIAFVHLRSGFGEAGFFSGGGEIPVEIGMDPARKVEEGFLKGLIQRSYMQVGMGRYSDPARILEELEGVPEEIEKDPSLSAEDRKKHVEFIESLKTFMGDVDPDIYRSSPMQEGVKFRTVPVSKEEREGARALSAYEVTFPQAITWGMIGCTAAFAASVVLERTRGTLLRLRIAPLSRMQILAGKALACFLTCVTVILFLLVTGNLVFGVRLPDPFALLLATGSTAICFVGIMMFIATLGKTEQSVSGAGWGVLMPLSMIGGAMIPVFAMPSWMQGLGRFSPVKWAILSVEGAVWREFSLTEMMPPCMILVACGALFFAIGVRVFSKAD
jgi:ABC-2 type transport system permease protein